MVNLYKHFMNLRDQNNSIIILGLDIKNKRLKKNISEILEIKNGLIGYKANISFYQGHKGKEMLKILSRKIGSDLIKLLDLKSPNEPTTSLQLLNEYSQYYDYITIAPSDGSIEETIEKAKSLGQNTISIGAMSFPNILKEINLGLPLFKQRIDRSIKAGTSAFFLNADSYVPESEFEKSILKYRNLNNNKPITQDEISDDELLLAFSNRNELFKYILEKTEDKEILYYVSGFTRQKGNLEHFLSSGINLNKCMINAGSDIIESENLKAELLEMNNIFNGYRKINRLI